MKEIQTDVLVVGSGAGGLATAVTAAYHGLDVLVIEKEHLFGGTTARSGGWLWVPCNPLARKANIPDSIEAARTYLQHECGAYFDAERVEAFLQAGPQAIAFFENHTALQFDLGPTFADYHPDAPGGCDGGRSIVAKPFDGRLLGKEIHRLRPPLREITLFGLMIGSGRELVHFFQATRSLRSAAYVVRVLARFLWDTVWHQRSMRLVNGNALVARLAKSAFDRGVRILTETPLKKLERDDTGRIIGGIAHGPEGVFRIRASRGVVLATGGFPHDPVRRAALLPHCPTGHEHVSPAPPGNTGDGLRLAESVGARTVTSLPWAAALVPISRPRFSDGSLGVFPHFVDRAKPGIIAVTRSGRRFVNEANSYHDFCRALIARRREEEGEDAEIAAWLIADHRAFRRYGLGFAKPSPFPYRHHLRSGYLIRGQSPEDLAQAIGADPEELARTITRFNADARAGVDRDFGKGSTSYNRSLGDASVTPNPCLAPLDEPPFFAVKVVIGDLGTFAGLPVDPAGRVRDADGKPIPGLFAVGNDAVSIMGGNYPGGGITLGPAVVFGWLAGRTLAGANSASPD